MDHKSAAFYSVIPATVRYDDRLSASAKLLYGEITSLAQSNGYCWATNAYFANLYQVTERSIRRMLNQLEQYDYIAVRVLGKDVEYTASCRRIYIDAALAALFDNGLLQNAPGGRTKMSDPDKNVRGGRTKMSTPTNNNKNNNISTRAAAKAKDAEAVNAALQTWAEGVTSDPAALVSCLTSFVEMRRRKHNPIQPGKAVTALTNKLMRYSEGGNLAIMIRMLEESIEHNWDSVYQLKPEMLREVNADQAACSPSGSEGGNDKWI